MKRSIVLWVTVILVVVVNLAYSHNHAVPAEADSRIHEDSRMANQVTSRIMRITSPQVAEPAPGTWS
jgi:hypothetical protein